MYENFWILNYGLTHECDVSHAILGKWFLVWHDSFKCVLFVSCFKLY